MASKLFIPLLLVLCIVVSKTTFTELITFREFNRLVNLRSYAHYNCSFFPEVCESSVVTIGFWFKPKASSQSNSALNHLMIASLDKEKLIDYQYDLEYRSDPKTTIESINDTHSVFHLRNNVWYYIQYSADFKRNVELNAVLYGHMASGYMTKLRMNSTLTKNLTQNFRIIIPGKFAGSIYGLEVAPVYKESRLLLNSTQDLLIPLQSIRQIEQYYSDILYETIPNLEQAKYYETLCLEPVVGVQHLKKAVCWDDDRETHTNLSKYVGFYQYVQSSTNQTRTVIKEKYIGNGGFGNVYKGFILETGEIVAIKSMEMRIFNMTKEVDMMKGLNHPNVIMLKLGYFSTISNGTSYYNLVLPFIPKNLGEVVRSAHMEKRFFHNELAKWYAYQTLKALEYLHDIGIVHGDIKLENILVDPQAQKAVIADFGSSRRENQTFYAYRGTRPYRSPEQLLNATYLHKPMDVWALGCVFATFFRGGELLFPGDHSNVTMSRILKWTRHPTEEDLEEMKPTIALDRNITRKYNYNMLADYTLDPLFIDLLDKMLTFNPRKRITAREAADHPYFDSVRDKWDQLNPKFAGLKYYRENGTIYATRVNKTLTCSTCTNSKDPVVKKETDISPSCSAC